MPEISISILFENLIWLIFVKKPGFFFILICFFLYKLRTTYSELKTSEYLIIALSWSNSKLSCKPWIISSSSTSLLIFSIINASILSISL